MTDNQNDDYIISNTIQMMTDDVQYFTGGKEVLNVKKCRS